MSTLALILAPVLTTGLVLAAAPAAPAPPDWAPFADESVVEILTTDPDGDARETKVWLVVVDGAGYVRTNDSRWLANIRRGSPVRLRAAGRELPVRAQETADPDVAARVEEAFLAKYGTLQSLMSFFRMREPTVLRLTFADATPDAR